MEGPFTFETLSAAESLEKKSRALTKVEPSFFRYVANYLEQLETVYRAEQSKNSASKKAAFLGDELRNAQNKAEEMWKAREKKIVNFAQVDARKDPAPPPPEHLTREESALYIALVKLLRDQWMRLMPLRVVASPSASPAPARDVVSQKVAPTSDSGAVAPAAPAAKPGEADALTIRALVDIPPFIGFDGQTYRIKKGDVLTLPQKFVSILKERNQVALVG